MNPELLEAVSCDRLHHDLFYLGRDPLPVRTVSYTIPWHTKNSLDEADDFIASETSLVDLLATRYPGKYFTTTYGYSRFDYISVDAST